MAHYYIKENETFNTDRNGTVPKPTQADVSAGKFLKADGTWGEGGGGGITDVTLDGDSVVNNQGVAELTTPDAGDIDYDNTTSGLSATKMQDAIDEIAQDFQDGCDTISQAVIAKGVTPASNSPSDIADAISQISGNKLYIMDYQNGDVFPEDTSYQLKSDCILDDSIALSDFEVSNNVTAITRDSETLFTLTLDSSNGETEFTIKTKDTAYKNENGESELFTKPITLYPPKAWRRVTTILDADNQYKDVVMDSVISAVQNSGTQYKFGRDSSNSYIFSSPRTGNVSSVLSTGMVKNKATKCYIQIVVEGQSWNYSQSFFKLMKAASVQKEPYKNSGWKNFTLTNYQNQYNVAGQSPWYNITKATVELDISTLGEQDVFYLSFQSCDAGVKYYKIYFDNEVAIVSSN